jgi:hypothetical protein
MGSIQRWAAAEADRRWRELDRQYRDLKFGRSIPPSSERNAEIAAKRKAGRTLQSIADEYRLHPTRVSRICRRTAA